MTALQDNIAALLALVPENMKFDPELIGEKFREKPAQNMLISLGAAAFVFYQAEKNVNPKVNTIYDALEYCSSSLSVGYTSIFPQTPVGKLVATLLMTFGPAMSGMILDGRPKPAECDATQQKILATLEQILLELRSAPNAAK
jgi:voltage-gated potassium channel